MHLVRNAIDHGIESPEARVKAGKRARGARPHRVQDRGQPNCYVSVSDDGGGLDYPAIRAKALSIWPGGEADIARDGRRGSHRFLFRPGFPTKATSTPLSGQGHRPRRCQDEVKAAKGQIHPRFPAGRWLPFTLLLPVSASTMDGMFVLCSGKKYFIPAAAIARTLLVDSRGLLPDRPEGDVQPGRR